MVHSHDFYRLYQDTYLTYKAIYGSSVAVFLQKGAFYEFYGQQDADGNHLNSFKDFTDILSCQVNVYEGDAPGGLTGLFAGVPDYTLDKWAGKLTSAGWTVVVINQDAASGSGGSKMTRSVSRVLSPGTHVENAETTSTCYVGAYDESTGLALVVDVTTGTIIYNAFKDHAAHFFQIYTPRELVNYNGQSLADSLQKSLYISSQTIIYNKPALQAPYNRPVRQLAYLQECFKPKTLLSMESWLGLTLPLQELLTALVLWIQDHHPTLVTRLPRPTAWHPTDKIRIINNALQQLNIIGSSPTTIEKLIETPYSAAGRRALSRALCSPYADPQQIARKQTDVAWMYAQNNRPNALKQIHDFSRIHRSIARGSVSPGSLFQLYQSLKTLQGLYADLRSSPFMDCTIGSGIDCCLGAYGGLFDKDKALKAQEAPADWGVLQQSVGPLTASVELAIQRIHVETHEWLRGLCIDAGLDASALSFKPTDKNDYAAHGSKSILQNIQEAFKRSGSTVSKKYSPAPAFKYLSSGGRLEHEYLDKQQQRLDAQRAALRRAAADELAKACISYSDTTYESWQPLEDWVIRVDHAAAYAATTRKYNWTMPTIQEGPAAQLTICGLRHPLIEIQQTAIELVTHDIVLDPTAKHGLLLYGVNASGKSSLMKAVGIAVLLAQLGCGVPALSMTFTPYKKIATRILNQDNLWAGLSSFAVEMTELSTILSLADQHTLVLGDELCAGTESISATAIVAAGIAHLNTCRSSFILATHLHDLNKLPIVTGATGLSIAHLKVHYDAARDVLIYDRTLSPGPGAANYGLSVAKALHMPPSVLEAAYACRRLLTGDTHMDDHPKSAPYNAAVLRRKCAVCETPITRDLEVHHIQDQVYANNETNADGTALHGLRNLVVVCRTCHDAHHAGSLHIGPVKQTSAGPERVIQRSPSPQSPSTSTSTIGGLSAEDVAHIVEIAKAHPSLSTKLLIFQVKERHDIDVTSAQIGTLRRKRII
jgi:DNA mismatch repair protein MutS